METKFWIRLVVACISALLVAAPGAAQAKEEQIQLTYSIFFPAAHGQAEAGAAWAREIEQRTNGRVKINVFPGGTLTSAKDCYDGVVKGISDIGMSCFAYSRGRFPIMETVDLPLGYPSGIVATRVANEFYAVMKPRELDDVKVLYLHAHGPGLLHTKKPVAKLEDLKGMKIRSTGFSAKVVEALGGIPVAMPQPDTYEALRKGVVDGTFTPIETLKGWKQAEVIKSTTDCVAVGYTTAMFVVMNKKKWESLPLEIKKVFDEVSAAWVDTHGTLWDKLDAEGRTFTTSLNNPIITLSPEENQRWVAAVSPIIDEFRTNLNKNGLPGDQAIAEIKRLLQRHTSTH
ncbi:MAG: TRAP transporter substrate-binding protein [Desulfobacterota bacterium]|nr:TRAP transporter substrate-binding protein [Thermodesulfobacteriota bacterium]